MQRNATRSPFLRTPRVLSMALLLVIAAVVLLHAVLLWQRLDDLSIARPEVATRWIGAAAIGVAALLLRRASSGSRGWVVFWLAVVLLHLAGPAGAVLTQAVLTATPLLLMFVAVAIGFACSYAPCLLVRHNTAECAELVSSVRGRAPPPR
jgi:hypothetical protein